MTKSVSVTAGFFVDIYGSRDMSLVDYRGASFTLGKRLCVSRLSPGSICEVRPHIFYIRYLNHGQLINEQPLLAVLSSAEISTKIFIVMWTREMSVDILHTLSVNVPRLLSTWLSTLSPIAYYKAVPLDS